MDKIVIIKRMEDLLAFRENQERKFEDVIVCTSTMYGTDDASNMRVKLALQFLEKAKELGLKVVIVEGGSTNQKFLQEATPIRFPNLTLIKSQTVAMGPKRRESLKTAMEMFPHALYFLYTEPEKSDLISAPNIKSMVEALENGANIVVPERRGGLKNYSRLQTWMEYRANKRVNKLTKPGTEKIDMWFGPKIFDRTAAREFLDYNKEGDKLDFWDAIHVPVITASKKGGRIVSVPIDFIYPEEQRAMEEGNEEFDKKRLDQYMKILAEAGDPFWKKQ